MLSRKVNYSPALRKHVRKYNLNDKMQSIMNLLGKDAQNVLNWAQEEAKLRIKKGEEKETNLAKVEFQLIANEAAIRLVKQNHSRGRMTIKSEVKRRTGIKTEMPLLYQEAGLRHPQEARNLRHNLFHEAFMALIMHLFPDVTTSVPATGEGLTPDLMVKHKNPNWTLSVEYKGYRAITLLSESEVLKGMRYQAAYGSSWLVTSTPKTVRDRYEGTLESEKLIRQGIERLERITKRKGYTGEQKENRGIARKGITHLEKLRGANLKCKLISAEELLDSCREGKPRKALAISTGMEFIEMLREAGFKSHANNVLRIMKTPTNLLHSDTVPSVRLIG